MSTERHGLSVSKPVSVWNRPLKADFRDLFKSLSKLAIHGASVKWDDAAQDAADALSALGLNQDPGQIAWLLIRRALTKAIFELVREKGDFSREVSRDLEALCDRLDLSLEQEELRIDERFFEHPGELPIVEQIQFPFSQWLIGYGLREAEAKAVCARLRSYFIFALNDEWQKRAKDYQPLKDVLDTPFAKAGKREQEWLRYSAWLEKQIDERMLDESFSLRQIYIPLRAYYEEKSQDKQAEEFVKPLDQPHTKQRVIVDLLAELTNWINKEDYRDTIKVISGGPGSGKSSFTKIFAAQLARSGTLRVLLIPLHLFNLSDDLIDAIREFTHLDEFLSFNPLDPQVQDGRLLLIFDGLDELFMQGKVAQQLAQDFLREVQRTVDRMNQRKLRLQVLLSGRELVVQANASEFRRPQQVLHLVPYYVPEYLHRNYQDPQQLLKADRRQEWWKRYGQCTGEPYDGMPKDLTRPQLTEITAQPLLNYLLALSFARKKVNFATEDNLNVIYDDLLRAVYERRWADYPHPALHDVNEGNFLRILEEIGIAAWHGDGRTTTVREIEQHCEQSGLKHLLGAFQEGAKAGVTRLLAAFYFRHRGHRQDGEQTFEFTHKSFGEYLTARRIVRAIQKIHSEIEKRKLDPDEGWEERLALEHWAQLCGAAVMDQYVFAFVRDEIRLRQVEEATGWQKTLSSLIGFMLRHGMPMERLNPRPAYVEETRQSRNAEESLLASLNACAQVTRNTEVSPRILAKKIEGTIR